MLKLNLIIFFTSIALLGCAEKQAKHSVEDYVNDPLKTKTVLSECNAKVVTITDHEKVFASGDCRNAAEASKQLTKKRNSSSNAPSKVILN